MVADLPCRTEIGKGEGSNYLVTTESSLPRALPSMTRYTLPPMYKFWPLFKAGTLVDITQRVMKAEWVPAGDKGLVYCLDREYYAGTTADPTARANPRAWFEANVRHAKSAAPGIKDVLGLQART